MGHSSYHHPVAQTLTSRRPDIEPEDAVFEEVSSSKTTLRSSQLGSFLTHQPFVQTNHNTNIIKLMGFREDGQIFPWGFWGGCALIAILIGLVVFRGSSGLFSLMDLLITMTLAALAVAIFRWGPNDSLAAQHLATVDRERNTLSWPSASGSGAELVLPFEDITEIVFAMIYFPVSPSRPESRIHVFTLLVRQGDDQLIPIIEASPNKIKTYDMAQMLSQWAEVPISQVGEGILSKR